MEFFHSTHPREKKIGMRRMIIVLFVLASASSQAQNSLKISGLVSDSITGLGIVNCSVSISSRIISARTDSQGYYEMFIAEPSSKMDITFRCLGYNDKVTRDVYVSSDSKNISVNAQLSPRVYQIGEGVQILGNKVPETIWGNEKYNVSDFAFLGNKILLLTYEREERWKRQEESKTTLLTECALVLIDSNYKEITQLTTPLICKSFYTDFFEDVFLVSRHEYHQILYQGDSLFLVNISEDDFTMGIKPIIDSVGSVVYYSTFDPLFPAFEYKSYDSDDSTYTTLRYMIDEDTMEMFRSEYKYLHPRKKLEAFRYELKTGIDKEIVAAYMSGFQNSPYYEPLNAPMFLANDTLLIFDHHHDKLIKLDGFGKTIDSTLITYHESKAGKWSGRVLLDKVNSEIYTTHLKGSYIHLSHISKYTGEVDSIFKLYYKYVENIRVYNNEVYYIYRPFESSQKKYLYRERIGRV